MFSWKNSVQNKKISILAPMEDVTDTVFRQVVMKLGRPDVFFTEFTNLEGLFSPGYDEVSMRFKYLEEEKPLIAQVWGLTPSLYEKGAKEIIKMGFDGMDINMGCAVPKIIKQGAGAALIANKELAKEIIKTAKESVGDFPLSIKTRLGFKELETEEWISLVLGFKPDALTVHVRTAAEMSKAPAHWEEMEKVVKLRNEISPETVLICNGDITSVEQGESLANKYGFEGYMIGRGIFSNPWVFNKDINIQGISVEERMNVLKFHLSLFKETWGNRKNYSVLKKYFKIYVSNFEGASAFREKLMATINIEQAIELVNNYI